MADDCPQHEECSRSQVEHAVDALAARTGEARVDVVGFSTGALVSRTFVPRLGGRDRVRRFVPISGPHQSTAMAWALPFRGLGDMRTITRRLRELAADPVPWGEVEVHVVYTPHDLVIVPATSSRLHGARSETRLPIALHCWMIQDARAISRAVGILAR